MENITLKAQDTFLNNLKLIMVDRNLSYKDLGDKMGLSKQRVSSMFNDDRGISLATVSKVAKALNIEETDLFDRQFKDRYKTKVK